MRGPDFPHPPTPGRDALSILADCGPFRIDPAGFPSPAIFCPFHCLFAIFRARFFPDFFQNFFKHYSLYMYTCMQCPRGGNIPRNVWISRRFFVGLQKQCKLFNNPLFPWAAMVRGNALKRGQRLQIGSKFGL